MFSRIEIMASASLRFLSLFKVLQWGVRFCTFIFPCLHFSLENLVKSCLAKWRTSTRTGIISDMKVVETYPTAKPSASGEICMEEIKTVLTRLGIACDQEGNDDDVENWKVSEFSDIMLDEEPSLEEIKQVFRVFDENNDGFIDAAEVQRVLCGLCLKEGSELEDCRRMICAFDDNGDGVLDFEEFLAFMGKCFC
ncbi:probable calcium-binding protein CML45 [Coffea eugenioides]|uniref:probable calcium-binding protein CML45 n=1 Tax=Coffea eugenioides TaxID=49369 RepID=UPI000F60FA7E|nr:probable calcium-binding protein CML45 [Coffea eugenioides]